MTHRSVTAVAPAPNHIANAIASNTSADHPASGREADLRSMHVGVEGRTDNPHDVGARVFIRFLERQADETHAREVTVQLVLGHLANDVDRADLNSIPKAALE